MMKRPMKKSVRIATGLVLAGMIGCTRPERPEPPAILRDVSLIDDDVQYTHPFVPGDRTTMDGRVALRVQGGPPGTFDLAHNLSFYLFTPERLDEPILSGPPGAQILADPAPFDVPFPPAFDPAVTRLGHHAICDPTQEFAAPGEHPNPQPCGADGTHDCYAFTVISSTSKTALGSQLWGTPVTVEVENPKTATARIIRADLGTPVAGAFIPLNNEWTEPSVTRDGRLLSGRWGRAPRVWTNPETGESKLRFYDLAYSVLPDDAAPCDITKWTQFNPISHAPFDPHMIGRYGLADYPFRDAQGDPIADGEDVGGTYPWVDREGTNVFMTGVPGRMVEQSTDAYPRSCVHDGCESYEENNDWDRGFQVAGLWTHGKFVHLDGLINNLDWAIGDIPAAHFLVDLYRDSAGQDVPVRLGSGRFIDSVRYAGGPYPPGYTHNDNILDSTMNLFNYEPNATPITPRDVVWIMGTGVGTEEIAFDDYVDPNAFIISNMQAAITPLYNENGESLAMPHYWNGQVRIVELPIAVPDYYVLAPDLAEDIHVQNAATSLGWSVPPFGLVAASTGRIEPTALGGIQGKGFWLTGSNAIRYAVAAQSRSIHDTDWYASLFVDPRTAEGDSRAVLSFPDGSAIRVAGHSTVEFTLDGAVVHEVQLPAGEGWVHLAVRVSGGNRTVTLIHDGFPLDRFESPAPLFQMSEGELAVGDASARGAGFRGWIDDFKVLAHDVNPEVACNHAHGTLVRIDDAGALGAAAADDYPAWAHEEIASAAGLGGSGSRFLCHHDYSRDYAANLANLPEGTTSVRGAINFPEGPLRAGAPRPDSSQNVFCHTCHEAHGKGGLSLAALDLDAGLTLENDPRRQPFQPPRRVFGNIPAGWIPPGAGPGSPDAPSQAPADGALIDRWILPGAGDDSARQRASSRSFVHRH